MSPRRAVRRSVRADDPPPPLDLRAGSLQVRLAAGAADIEAAQGLRYRVFYQEMGAHPTIEMALARRDIDPFDEICDHLLVIDHARGAPLVVGTYRLIRRAAAERFGRFYSAGEYDIAPIASYPGAVLELGRSCVEAAWRTKSTMQLLWRGISAYVFEHGIELMFGCASLPGTDPAALALPLSYLHQFHLAPASMRPRALRERFLDMNLLPAGSYDPAAAQAMLPPLIKGYLRLGGFVGEGAVVDQQFNTTDVCIVVKTDLVTEKYYRHYERRARAAAVA